MRLLHPWNPIQTGDIIDIICPGYAVTDEVLSKSVAVIESWGYRARVPDELLKPEFFHSNSDAKRFAHLKTAITSKDSSAIWCLRGGYGSNRLIPSLAKIRRPLRSKVLIGISDITSIHSFLNQKWGWPTLHASLVDRIAKGNLPDVHLQETLRCLTGEQKTVEHKLSALNEAAKKAVVRKGMVRGGNLTTLQSLIGTPWNPHFKNCFLFLEDLGERGYRVDRMLEHLIQAGALNGCQGVVFGHFTGGEELNADGSRGLSRVPEALQRFALYQKKIPVWQGVQSGHDIDLRPVPLQTPAVLRQGILSIQTGFQVVGS